jgi:beta-carotene ketolase (CrtW type)
LRVTGWQGLWLAGLILLFWLVSLTDAILTGPGSVPVALAGVLVRTLLHTGLFIAGHDAMHGVLVPGSQRWNRRAGTLALALYGALPYGRCQRNHALHHQRTATTSDPDFLADPTAGPMGWYLHFMGGYLNPWQMGLLLGGWAGLASAIAVLHELTWQQALGRVLLVCTLPLLLSSLQLFMVGTYLPHRGERQMQSATGAGGPISLAWPTWLSLLACYHFGYHREHHQQPHLAWYELPGAYQRNKMLALPR